MFIFTHMADVNYWGCRTEPANTSHTVKSGKHAKTSFLHQLTHSGELWENCNGKECPIICNSYRPFESRPCVISISASCSFDNRTIKSECEYSSVSILGHKVWTRRNMRGVQEKTTVLFFDISIMIHVTVRFPYIPGKISFIVLLKKTFLSNSVRLDCIVVLFAS